MSNPEDSPAAQKSSPREERMAKPLTIVSAFFILLGLALNQWVVNAWLGGSSETRNQLTANVFTLLQLALVGWGLATYMNRRRSIFAKMNLAAVSLFFVAPIAGEIAFRAAISRRVKPFVDPTNYADPYSDDDYWKLLYRWHERYGFIEELEYDENLGWRPEKGEGNPLALMAGKPYSPDYQGKVALFYGDSYVAGLTKMEKRAPQQLDALLPERTVYNFGVHGYGLDQTYLRFKQTFSLFNEPVIIIGLLTSDIDRALLTMRPEPKPYFRIEEGGLKLNGTPVPPDAKLWLDENPPRIASYMLRYIRRRIQLYEVGGHFMEIQAKQEAKREIGGLLLEGFAESSRENGLPLVFVIFYETLEYYIEGWREAFLHEELERLGIPYIDTKALIQGDVESTGRQVRDYYRWDGHLNALGNELVARAVGRELDRRWNEPVRL